MSVAFGVKPVVQQVNKVVLHWLPLVVVVVSSYIFCVLLLFTCRGEVHIGKRTKKFVQKLLRIIDCQNGGLRNLSSLCTALLVQKLSVCVSFIHVLKLVELSALLARQYVSLGQLTFCQMA